MPRLKTVRQEIGFFKRLVVLVGFKEAYFLGKNVLGMILHPHLTTAKIIKKKDYSQAFLVFGLPFALWLILLVSSFLIWFIWRPGGFFSQIGAAFFILAGLLLMLIAFYDFYWVAKYLKRVKRI